MSTVYPTAEISAPNAIFVLSGGIKQVKTSNNKTRYRSTAFSDCDPRGLLGGGKARVIAVGYLADCFPHAYLVTTSRVEPDFPSHASVMADELIRYGVLPHRIVLEEKSTSTISELVEMIQLAIEHEWNPIWAVTNEYHIPRVREMYIRNNSLASSNNVSVHFIAAEDMLVSRSRHYMRLIEKVKQTESYRKRIAAETHGIEALRQGTYRNH